MLCCCEAAGAQVFRASFEHTAECFCTTHRHSGLPRPLLVCVCVCKTVDQPPQLLHEDIKAYRDSIMLGVCGASEESLSGEKTVRWVVYDMCCVCACSLLGERALTQKLLPPRAVVVCFHALRVRVCVVH